MYGLEGLDKAGFTVKQLLILLHGRLIITQIELLTLNCVLKQTVMDDPLELPVAP